MTTLELIFVLFLVLANGFFVAAEFALVKVRLSQIEQLARAGSFPARVARNVLQHLDAYLSACQLGITLASLGLGWVGEDVSKKLLRPALAALSIPDAAADYLSLPLAFVLITFLHISLGEQAPKIMAIRAAQPTALVVSLPLTVFYKGLWPFIWVLHKASDLMLRAIGVRAGRSEEHTSELQSRLHLVCRLLLE